MAPLFAQKFKSLMSVGEVEKIIPSEIIFDEIEKVMEIIQSQREQYTIEYDKEFKNVYERKT